MHKEMKTDKTGRTCWKSESSKEKIYSFPLLKPKYTFFKNLWKMQFFYVIKFKHHGIQVAVKK